MLAWDVCPGEETVAAYIAGKLAPGERDAIDSHLDTCNTCQELVAVLAKIEPPRSAPGPIDTTSLGAASTLGIARESAGWTPGGQLGRYVLLSRLGAGGMGVIYSAYDPELDRRVALKVLRHARAGEELRDEARAIARLAHPNVVAVHDVGRADGEVFVAMEHVEGVTVRDWLQTPRTKAHILDVFVQAGRGLAAAHHVGLVHRDVKPSNIIVGTDGRARVLDFGLARAEQADDAGISGTPGYMAPEQQAGERIDVRADQFAFCVALWESLGGKRPVADEKTSLGEVTDRVTRALRRGLASRPEDRFATMDDLLRELAPPQRRGRRWVVATILALAALGATLVVSWSHARSAPSCARVGDPLGAVWGEPQRAAMRASFGATKLDYASAVAGATIAELDGWAARWQHSAEASCRATVIDRTQPAEVHALRQGCLDQLVERMRSVVALATSADPKLVSRADVFATSLPSPERCDDIAALAALPPPPPAERDRAEVAAVRAAIADAEAALLAGRASTMRSEIAALQQRAEAVAYLPLRARSQLLVARLEISSAHYAEGIAALHKAARAATAARDLEQLADIWIELDQALGNDQRSVDEAEIFDGYAEALIAQLPDRAPLALQLEFARCNRNPEAKGAAAVAKHCEAAIEQAEHATPPRANVANAARTRLGHFQRLQGQSAQALATLHAAVDEAVRVHGAQHPDTAVARYSLGIAELAEEKTDDAIVQLRRSLEIRRAAFPGGSIQVAESLQGLGDALSTQGNDKEAIVHLEEALTILDGIHEGDSAQAANVQILLGLSLEEVHRDEDAVPHYLHAADIADRTLQHREALAAMGLRLAANVEAKHKHAQTGVEHIERALRLLERGKAPPREIGLAQYRLSQFLLGVAPPDVARARAMAEAARASFVTAGAAGTTDLAVIDKHLRDNHWR
jgi:tetratricopeptide (TPR) repeat protein